MVHRTLWVRRRVHVRSGSGEPVWRGKGFLQTAESPTWGSLSRGCESLWREGRRVVSSGERSVETMQQCHLAIVGRGRTPSCSESISTSTHNLRHSVRPVDVLRCSAMCTASIFFLSDASRCTRTRCRNIGLLTSVLHERSGDGTLGTNTGCFVGVSGS